MDNVNRILSQHTDKYRPLPFWSWNDKLSPDELRTQIREMKAKGLGGFFMHARGGLITPYMEKEWMECIAACLDEAAATGMDAWCYDEQGWPSGFAGGAVVKKGNQHRVKWLETVDNAAPDDTVLGSFGGKTVVIKDNPFYIDTLSADSVQVFIESTHQSYYDEFSDTFGKVMPGFFTDEPQYKLGKFPWSTGFESDFLEQYGYSITDCFEDLFEQTENSSKIRHDYWKLVSERMCDAFAKQIGDWCESHGVALTGHVMSEDSLVSQMHATAGSMPIYEYMQLPGIDWLGRQISTPEVPKQVGSAAAQLGKSRVLSEMFALCGWDVSLNELKWIAEWQFVNGINLICQHLEGYSLKGARKRDYPPSLFTALPWWEKYGVFNDYFAKLGALLGTGTDTAEVLLLHPMTSAHITYNTAYDEAIVRLDTAYTASAALMSGIHVGYHLGDETLMAKYGVTESGTLKIGKTTYKAVVLPLIYNLEASTFALLKAFKAEGGTIVALDKSDPLLEGCPSDELSAFMADIPVVPDAAALRGMLSCCDSVSIIESGTECDKVHVTSRDLDGQRLWYIVNLDIEIAHPARITLPTDKPVKALCLENGSEEGLPLNNGSFDIVMQPAMSLLLVEGDAETDNRPVEALTMGERFTLERYDENALTLDCCEYKLDDGVWQGPIPLITLQEQLIDRRYSGSFTLRQHFTVDCPPDEIPSVYFCMENPAPFKIKINSQSVDSRFGEEFFVDRCIRRADIGDLLKQGKNEVEVHGEFYQREHVYNVLNSEEILETELNMLTYDTELESTYIVGDFTVFSLAGYTKEPRNAMWTAGPFVLRPPLKKGAELSGDMTHQGFCFFAGTLDLNQTVKVNKQDGVRYILSCHPRAALSEVLVNGKSAGLLLWSPFTLDLTEHLQNGDNSITLRLYSGNRNLLGPHHFPGGECYSVTPSSFSSRPGWGNMEGGWEDRYCLVTFGV